MIIKPLVPFDSVSAPSIDLMAKVDRRGSDLHISYEMTGALDSIVLASKMFSEEHSERRWLLWEETCFEFFLGVPGESGYWEINLSPAEHWNVFRLDSYRSGIHEEPAIQQLPIQVDRSFFSLETTLDLNLLGIGDSDLELSITAVIADRSNPISYWALVHSETDADFHLRDSFILKFSASFTRQTARE
jgi:hypothetical protein